MKGYSNKLTGVAGLLVLLALLVVANLLAGHFRLRIDTTSEKLYTLSAGTRSVLESLPRDVTLKFYATRSADVPTAFKQYAQRIGDLLAEYEKAAPGRLHVEVLDPKPDSDEEEWAQRYGVVGQRIDPLGEGSAVYLGLAALAGAQQKAIPFFSPGDEPKIEYLVTRLVTEVVATNKPKLGLVSTLPIMGLPGSFMSPGSGRPAWVVISELRNQYQVEQLPPHFREVPSDMDTVLVVHPKRIPDSLLYALDQFVLRGGKLMVFSDPLCLAEQDAQPMEMGMPDYRSDFNRLTTAWGLTQETERVLYDAATATRVRMPDGSTDRNPTWLSLRTPNFNQQEIATAPLEAMLAPMAGFYSGQPADGLTLTPLITASPGAGSLNSMEARMGGTGGPSSYQPLNQPAYLALRLSGKFKTAFPDGRPQDPEQPATTPGASTGATDLKESSREGSVVLVADVDMLYDEFAVQRMNMLGRTLLQLANDNINFAVNLAGQMTGGDPLISLRSRGTFDRPFTRVLDLQKVAQEKWRVEEEKLQEQLRVTQLRLTELEDTKDPAQQYVISPEQKKEVEQFREQATQTRRQLKDVRKNLRQDIESLGYWIKGLNLAAVPGAVILFGLIHGWRRRSRAGS